MHPPSITAEYSSQLDSILSVLLRVPLLVMERVRQRHWQAVEEACGPATATYHEEIERLEVEKVRSCMFSFSSCNHFVHSPPFLCIHSMYPSLHYIML